METCDIYSEPKSFSYKTFKVDGARKTAIIKVCPAGKVLIRGSNMSDHVLLNLFLKLGKRDQMSQAFYYYSATSLIYSIKQEDEC